MSSTYLQLLLSKSTVWKSLCFDKFITKTSWTDFALKPSEISRRVLKAIHFPKAPLKFPMKHSSLHFSNRQKLFSSCSRCIFQFIFTFPLSGLMWSLCMPSVMSVLVSQWMFNNGGVLTPQERAAKRQCLHPLLPSELLKEELSLQQGLSWCLAPA